MDQRAPVWATPGTLRKDGNHSMYRGCAPVQPIQRPGHLGKE